MKKPTLNELTLREKIAQMMIVRLSDIIMEPETNYTSIRNEEEGLRIMRESQFGGIWLNGNIDINGVNDFYNKNFHYDAAESRALFDKMQKQTKYPLLSANDIAGTDGYSDLSAPTMGLAVGAADNVELTEELGYCIAMEHKKAGLNWLWDPVADIHSLRSPGVVRIFSNEYKKSAKHCSAFIKGIQKGGVAACAKHFPGKDKNEYRDSHVVTTIMGVSYEEWKETQGAVFQKLIDDGVYTIMSACTSFPAVDDRQINGHYLPGAFSDRLITDVLKKEMGFDGVVMTDDVQMAAFVCFFTGKRLFAQLINAGNDMLLGVGLDAIDAVLEAVNEGLIPLSRIDDACRRVLDLKEKLGLFKDDYTNDAVDFDTNRTKKASLEVMRQGLTLVCDHQKALPIRREVKKVTIVAYAHIDDILQRLEPMAEEFRRRGAEVRVRSYIEGQGDMHTVAQWSDLIVYVGYLFFHAPMGAPTFHGKVFWSLRFAFTEGAEKSVGIAMGYPNTHYEFMDDLSPFVDAYMLSPEAQVAFVEGLFGEIEFQGKRPVD
ncbi:MAG: glycoside hydrolase family 3 protein [Ruminococcaceae bacterium]|nr:glycoside hydrolase family 3 protein [Oscillospiraceae bacterium]